MDLADQETIKLLVQDEEQLYTPFSPDPELSSGVKSYLKSKAVDKVYKGSSLSWTLVDRLSLTVIAREPLDEERFRLALSRWIEDERKELLRARKIDLRTLWGGLVFGSIMIILSLTLEQQFDVLQYSLLPIIGSLALGKAAGILVLDLPTNRGNEKILNRLASYSVVRFEYGRDESGTGERSS